jgi:threonine dehydrogenase-like Zn-dependent dehydrogenase
VSTEQRENREAILRESALPADSDVSELRRLPGELASAQPPPTNSASQGRESMPKAVRYHEFGGIDVLRVDEVERAVPGDGQILVRVKAAGINPSEAVIRTGALSKLFPSTFPSGQGTDLAGVIEEVGAGVGGFSPGDEVIGFTQQRASQAELVWSRPATSRASRRRCRGRWPAACTSSA